MGATSPTVRQRELGKRLREIRNRRGLTVEDVAEKLLCSATKISRLETGARHPSFRDVRDLCELYDLDEPTSIEFMTLAREARQQGWWTQYEDLKMDPYLGLEAAATVITSYTMYYVPTLLQTEEYIAELIKTIAPKMDQRILYERVEARMRRQQRLEEDDPPRYRVLLDEAVLHRAVGGPKMMAGQLGKIIQAERHGKVTVQIVPFDVGAHAAQDSNFILFEFAEDTNQSPVVSIEGLTGMQYLEKSADVIRYREAIECLRDSALNPRDTIALIAERQRVYAGKVIDELA